EAILVHDSGNVVEQVDTKKQSGETKRAFLDGAEAARHIIGAALFGAARWNRCWLFLRRGYNTDMGMLRRRSFVLVLALLLVSSFLLIFAKIFEYSAAPAGEKQSDFISPPTPDQAAPVASQAETGTAAIQFRQRAGFINDASHLNKTAIYGI